MKSTTDDAQSARANQERGAGRESCRQNPSRRCDQAPHRQHREHRRRHIAHRLFRVCDDQRVPGDQCGGQPTRARAVPRRAKTSSDHHERDAADRRNQIRPDRTGEQCRQRHQHRKSERIQRRDAAAIGGRHVTQWRGDIERIHDRKPRCDRLRLDQLSTANQLAGADVAVAVRSTADRREVHDAVARCTQNGGKDRDASERPHGVSGVPALALVGPCSPPQHANDGQHGGRHQRTPPIVQLDGDAEEVDGESGGGREHRGEGEATCDGRIEHPDRHQQHPSRRGTIESDDRVTPRLCTSPTACQRRSPVPPRRCDGSSSSLHERRPRRLLASALGGLLRPAGGPRRRRPVKLRAVWPLLEPEIRRAFGAEGRCSVSELVGTEQRVRAFPGCGEARAPSGGRQPGSTNHLAVRYRPQPRRDHRSAGYPGGGAAAGCGWRHLSVDA